MRPLRLDYLETVQKNLSPSMRGILVDWLVEVAEEYELSSEVRRIPLFNMIFWQIT